MCVRTHNTLVDTGRKIPLLPFFLLQRVEKKMREKVLPHLTCSNTTGHEQLQRTFNTKTYCRYMYGFRTSRSPSLIPVRM